MGTGCLTVNEVEGRVGGGSSRVPSNAYVPRSSDLQLTGHQDTPPHVHNRIPVLIEYVTACPPTPPPSQALLYIPTGALGEDSPCPKRQMSLREQKSEVVWATGS